MAISRLEGVKGDVLGDIGGGLVDAVAENRDGVAGVEFVAGVDVELGGD